MHFPVPDRISTSRLFWLGLRKYGLAPSAVLRRAHLPLLPLTACADEQYALTTAQNFALWRAIEELCADPAFGLNFGAQLDFAALHPSAFLAYHARDYRDALARHVRFSQICLPKEVYVETNHNECVIESKWLYATEEVPPLLVDLSMAILVEIGRRGTQYPVTPKRIELKRTPERTGIHRAHFNCPIRFKSSRNAIVLPLADLDRPFVTYNAELVDMLQTQLEKKLEGYKRQSSTNEQVKWILKKMLPSGRPNIVDVARELGVSVRTLQRQMATKGTTFRKLLLAARQELTHQYLAQPELQISEIAFCLGYESTNSFYRAFHAWEGTTPALWRSSLGDAEASVLVQRAKFSPTVFKRSSSACT
jgi:AraC-like DNA-binding protein